MCLMSLLVLMDGGQLVQIWAEKVIGSGLETWRWFLILFGSREIQSSQMWGCKETVWSCGLDMIMLEMMTIALRELIIQFVKNLWHLNNTSVNMHVWKPTGMSMPGVFPDMGIFSCESSSTLHAVI